MKISYITLFLISVSACKDDSSYKNQRILNTLQLFESCALPHKNNNDIVDCWRATGKRRDDFPHRIEIKNSIFTISDDRFDFEIIFFKDKISPSVWKCSIKEPGFFLPKHCTNWKHGE